jgi:hypothetical protein
MQPNDAAKLGFIRAYFDEEERKVSALSSLAASERRIRKAGRSPAAEA